jgi:hypothetical protein
MPGVQEVPQFMANGEPPTMRIAPFVDQNCSGRFIAECDEPTLKSIRIEIMNLFYIQSECNFLNWNWDDKLKNLLEETT